MIEGNVSDKERHIEYGPAFDKLLQIITMRDAEDSKRQS
jgi:hypothetical protein